MTNCSELKIVICSGGTGGHMFPACALFKALQKKGSDVVIVTDTRGNTFCHDISEKIVLNTIRFSYKNFLLVSYYSLLAFLKFCKFWFGKRPHVIVGFGGIFTVIPLLLSKILGSKIIIYEQNSVLGKANKLLERFADLKLTSFRLDENWIEIPAPVRSEFLKNIPYKCDEVVKILIIGGSQGATSFSNIVPQAIGMLDSRERKDIEIIQQVNYANIDQLERAYQNLGVRSTLKNFVHDIAEVMLNSQLVICRSGASTLSELSATGRPAILIPYPNASDNHQYYNALYYKNKKAAWLLEEKDDVAVELGKILRQILQNRELLKIASFYMLNSSVNSAVDSFIKHIELA
ncbi:MAG: UDP-N-acetylglucosamine--N-acetylmuramyl-(pentapeptide) pyrophosphoryl-undecaprenol N-acetylglucosamine transferase [Holosporaceae bacterium]|jgi:UDP-N-acetylglucosamine--N-acetylmuramyl-(pentapeptide) pyrophosphoryl-undecaprenol N-acetylglucosamine transferase|nr:UDP-N-acetylglucosamine--N-acetylmuramyl-(pentapeptide) pyrophosphoryl-undecaprenol N-acetylglucosamine transferase [Holosporaceae bacterium]